MPFLIQFSITLEFCPYIFPFHWFWFQPIIYSRGSAADNSNLCTVKTFIELSAIQEIVYSFSVQCQSIDLSWMFPNQLYLSKYYSIFPKFDFNNSPNHRWNVPEWIMVLRATAYYFPLCDLSFQHKNFHLMSNHFQLSTILASKWLSHPPGKHYFRVFHSYSNLPRNTWKIKFAFVRHRSCVPWLDVDFLSKLSSLRLCSYPG